jgi:hypothetical protein
MVSFHRYSLPATPHDRWFCLFTLVLLAGILLLVYPATAATTSLHIEKVARDGKTILSSKDVDIAWMETNLPVHGDGVTRYYHQGPVFIDNPDPATEVSLRWNPVEDTNVREKDMGAVKGTAVKDLCTLVGGMDPGDTVTVRANDGFTKTFAYRNVYEPSERQGPMVITWYHDGEGYVPDYATGMRLIFFADTSSNPWGIHAFGNWDWHESADPEYYYYYVQGGERYPTTTGLSVQQVATLTIHQGQDSAGSSPDPSPSSAPLGILIVTFGILGGCWIHFRTGDRR